MKEDLCPIMTNRTNRHRNSVLDFQLLRAVLKAFPNHRPNLNLWHLFLSSIRSQLPSKAATLAVTKAAAITIAVVAVTILAAIARVDTEVAVIKAAGTEAETVAAVVDGIAAVVEVVVGKAKAAEVDSTVNP